MSKYVDLATVGTRYAQRMNHLSNRIFGEVTRPTNQKSMKVVKLFTEMPVNKRPDIVKYYPRHPQTGWLIRNLRMYGLFKDEHHDFKEENDQLREIKNKGKKQKWLRKLAEKGITVIPPEQIKKRFTEDF